jgi:hypothetical protein
MANLHTHGDAPPHEHDEAVAGHTHDARADTTTTETSATHSHGDTTSHTHADAAPGHTHEETMAFDAGPAPGGLAARVILTLLGAAGMIVGAFLSWGGSPGTEVEVRAFFSVEAGGEAALVTSAGFVLIVLGVVALVGLAPRSGALTSVAGALGLVATILWAVTMYRGEASLDELGLGFWLAAVGSLIALLAGFFGSRANIVTRTGPEPVA